MTTQTADNHILANAILLFLTALLGLSSCCSTAFNVLQLFGVIDGGLLPPASEAEQAGQLIAFVWVGLWSITMTLMCPFGGIGLVQRRSWGRKLGIATWGICALGCCCTLPVCAYGIWSLSRPAIKTIFEKPS